MRSDQTPRLDHHTAQTLVREMLARLPGYVPNWAPAEGSPGLAVIQVFARYLHALIERLNQAPDKNKLAFLDLLGINLLPAQAARAPVVFEALANLGDSRVAARTRVGARRPEQADPLVFETERAIALVAARLVEVVSLWPDRDAYADHGAAILRGEPFRLFEPLEPIPHELYLGHGVALALAGKSALELHFELAAGATPLAIAWEYWDGERWQAFKAPDDTDQTAKSLDGTDGLSRSGVVRLTTECGDAVRTKVQGVDTYWVRGRLTAPLPPQPGAVLPAVDRIRLRTVVERPLRQGVIKVLDTGSGPFPIFGCVGDIQPDQAFADASKLDVSKIFYPLGRNADRNNAFYFASEEVFSKPGAEVTLCLRRAVTPEEEADKLEAKLIEETARKLILDAASKAVQAVIDAANSASSLAIPLLADPNQNANALQLLQQRTALQTKKNALKEVTEIDDLAADAAALVQTLFQLQPQLVTLLLDTQDLSDLKKLIKAAGDFTVKITSAGQDVLVSLGKLGALVTSGATGLVLDGARWAAKTVIDSAQSLILLSPGNLTFIEGLKEVEQLKTAVADLTEISGIDDLATIAESIVKAVDQEFEVYLLGLILFDASSSAPMNLVSMLVTAASNAQVVLKRLGEMGGLEGAGTVGEETNALAPPRLVWEYWNGLRWKRLLGPVADESANFLASGTVSFSVPDDLTPTTVNNVAARWLRVRLESGTYGRLRMVSWHDAVSSKVNLMSVIEPRPPALEAFFLGYIYRSAKVAPDHCLAYNDFQYEDQSQAVTWPGPPFYPFHPTADRTPALYLGLDRPLPADLISLYFDIKEMAEQSEGPPLKWEYYDDGQWLPLGVEDETANLALPGMVAAIWPGVQTPAPAAVLQASGERAQLEDERQAARFAPGDLLSIVEDGEGELVTVTAISGKTLTLKTPLGRSYGRAAISPAALARFGTPRTWVRARLELNSDPPRPQFAGIHLNAVWATQIQTVENELLGSSSAQAGQSLFFRQTPVLEGEMIEVRELEGPRAAVELPILREELLAQGMTDLDIRTVEDRRTGQTSEVWVRWRVRPNLFFSGPSDRDVVIERTRGRVIFGDNGHGRIPSAGVDNVRALIYRSGGGLAGNVPSRAISQLLSGVLAEKVGNPRAAEGGADTESVEAVLTRGPQAVRHRRQALSRADYEALAREASPAVAVARALPATHPNGRPAPGWVTLVIVPASTDPQPEPSYELRRRVREFLLARVPASIAGLAVTGPNYLPIGVEAVVAPLSPSEAGLVGQRAARALAEFLHPLTGGPEGAGWPFGRGVYLSDVAAILEATEGVDYVETINLLLDATPHREVVNVPADRIVVAGPVEIKLKASER